MNIIETHQQFRALWGASSIPFEEISPTLFEYDEFTNLANNLTRFISMKLSGILFGPNGSGKSVLLDHVLNEMPEQQFMVIRMSHTTLTGPDMIRQLCRSFGLPVSIRRSDNIHQLLAFWKSDGRLPVLAIDEAQNLSPDVLEELRLLNCGRTRACGENAQAPFSMILCGDEDLLPTIGLKVHRALRSRLSFNLQMKIFDPQTSVAYCHFRWKEAGVPVNPFDEQTLHLLHSASEGLPRTINQLAQNTILCAIDRGDKIITVEHLQEVLEAMPWIGRHSR